MDLSNHTPVRKISNNVNTFSSEIKRFYLCVQQKCVKILGANAKSASSCFNVSNPPHSAIFRATGLYKTRLSSTSSSPITNQFSNASRNISDHSIVWVPFNTEY